MSEKRTECMSFSPMNEGKKTYLQNNSLKEWGVVVFVIAVIDIGISVFNQWSSVGGLILFLTSVVLFVGSSLEKAIFALKDDLKSAK